ncbi:MAG: alpha-L-fucosidase, partial [Candidatus Cloacimonetes bacterium]|nr:alpha-L-fucosidase [Candidatus Cloacimonadota bacterium]
MKRISTGLFILVIALSVWGVTESKEDYMNRMDWFKDAKLGIFIHWGIYSVNGIDESWSFYNNYISYDNYMKQTKGFSAEKYKPEKWARLIKDTGARYAVLTTKHHDGVALWDTKYNDRDVVNLTPAKRDLIAPFCDALRKEDIKVGLYYSLIDWSDDNYPNFTITKKRYEEDAEKWDAFVKFYQGQIEELSTKYNPDLYWFDGDWERTAEQWKAKELKEKLLGWNPKVIVNSRLQGYGDYATPEQGIPISKPDSDYWELCMTMNDSWGYQGNDKNYKTPYQIIRIFIDCISKGGNLLLDIGPKADGTIPEEQVEILKELARWNKKHYEAVFESTAGIDTKYTDYPSTLSNDRKTLYLFYPHIPTTLIKIRNLNNSVKACTILGTNEQLSWKRQGSDILIKANNNFETNNILQDADLKNFDPMVTVIKIQLYSEIDIADEFTHDFIPNENNCLFNGNTDFDSLRDYIYTLSTGTPSEEQVKLVS